MIDLTKPIHISEDLTHGHFITTIDGKPSYIIGSQGAFQTSEAQHEAMWSYRLLFEAAPDMLRFLKFINHTYHVDSCPFEDDLTISEFVENTIAKIEGK